MATSFEFILFSSTGSTVEQGGHRVLSVPQNITTGLSSSDSSTTFSLITTFPTTSEWLLLRSSTECFGLSCWQQKRRTARCVLLFCSCYDAFLFSNNLCRR